MQRKYYAIIQRRKHRRKKNVHQSQRLRHKRKITCYFRPGLLTDNLDLVKQALNNVMIRKPSPACEKTFVAILSPDF